MSSNPLRLKQLLDKYLKGNITHTELEEFWQLMSSLSENDLVDEEMSKFWSDPSLDKNSQADWEGVYSRLQQRMDDQQIDYARIIQPRRSIRPWVIAASFLFLLAVSFLLVLNPFEKNKKDAIVSSRSSFDLQVIRLPDGTAVTLNHNSKLDYPNTFNGKTREVYLYGEAFFDVKHDPLKPFIVHTGNVITRVLGTAFNIKAYDNEENIAVTVSRGKVQVQKNNEDKVFGLLVAGDQLTVDKKEDKALQTKVDVSGILQWKTKDLVFDDKTIDEASVIISNYFGVEIHFANESLRKCRFTASFNGSDDDLKQVLDVMTVLTGSTWTKDDKEIIWIGGKGCSD